MFSNTIKKILLKDKKTKKIFKGVFARDEVPINFNYPACFIVNTDERSKPGHHWLAFFYDKKKVCYFFDSYGKPPSFYKFDNYINKTSKKCFFNNKRIQGYSQFCGFYSIFYLLFKTRGKETFFFKKFNKNMNENDKFIQKQIEKWQ